MGAVQNALSMVKESGLVPSGHCPIRLKGLLRTPCFRKYPKHIQIH